MNKIFSVIIILMYTMLFMFVIAGCGGNKDKGGSDGGGGSYNPPVDIPNPAYASNISVQPDNPMVQTIAYYGSTTERVSLYDSNAIPSPEPETHADSEISKDVLSNDYTALIRYHDIVYNGVPIRTIKEIYILPETSVIIKVTNISGSSSISVSSQNNSLFNITAYGLVRYSLDSLNSAGNSYMSVGSTANAIPVHVVTNLPSYNII